MRIYEMLTEILPAAAQVDEQQLIGEPGEAAARRSPRKGLELNR
jgi:hypothetical protein